MRCGLAISASGQTGHCEAIHWPAMPDRLPCVFWNEVLELAFRPLMLEKCRARGAEHGGELRPGIRGVHVDDADRLNARARRLGVDQVGHLPALHTAPEFLFG